MGRGHGHVLGHVRGIGLGEGDVHGDDLGEDDGVGQLQSRVPRDEHGASLGVSLQGWAILVAIGTIGLCVRWVSGGWVHWIVWICGSVH